MREKRDGGCVQGQPNGETAGAGGSEDAATISKRVRHRWPGRGMNLWSQRALWRFQLEPRALRWKCKALEGCVCVCVGCLTGKLQLLTHHQRPDASKSPQLGLKIARSNDGCTGLACRYIMHTMYMRLPNISHGTKVLREWKVGNTRK